MTGQSQKSPRKTPTPLRDVIARHGLRAKRHLGQHFLLDYNLTRRIVKAAGDLTGVHVIEIGPGPGGLTRALLESDAATVTAIERDTRCLAALGELADEFPQRLTLVEGDALTTDPAQITDAPRKIVANLPYNIGTQLLLQWLDQVSAYESLTLMFQKEVAERLAAQPGTKSYGRPSILTQWLCEVELLFDVAPRAFTPPPKVTSCVVQLTPRLQPLFVADRKILEKVTAAAFGQRRKMLRSSLKQITDDPAGLLRGSGIDPQARAETLTIEQFCALARALDTDAG